MTEPINTYAPLITNLRVVQREYIHPDDGLKATEYQFQIQHGHDWHPIQVIREVIVLASDGSKVTMVPTQWLNDEETGE